MNKHVSNQMDDPVYVLYNRVITTIIIPVRLMRHEKDQRLNCFHSDVKCKQAPFWMDTTQLGLQITGES